MKKREVREGRSRAFSGSSKSDEIWCRYQNADAIVRLLIPCLLSLLAFPAGVLYVPALAVFAHLVIGR
jgi:hypothetical protein